jgi:hypothetical protein
MSIGTYGEPDAVSNAIGYQMHRSRSHDAVICVHDAAGNVIETHEHAGNFKNRESVSQFVPDLSRGYFRASGLCLR